MTTLPTDRSAVKTLITLATVKERDQQSRMLAAGVRDLAAVVGRVLA